jgi:hypothetical protein
MFLSFFPISKLNNTIIFGVIIVLSLYAGETIFTNDHVEDLPARRPPRTGPAPAAPATSSFSFDTGAGTQLRHHQQEEKGVAISAHDDDGDDDDDDDEKEDAKFAAGTTFSRNSSSSSTTSKATPSRRHDCWRHCPQRKNIIFFAYNRAGLNDRSSIINQLAQIAGYLCARLELPPPSFLLNPRHNNGLDISRDIVWPEFRNITFREDNSSVYVDQYSSSFDQNFTDWHKIPVYDKEKYSDWLLLYIVF